MKKIFTNPWIRNMAIITLGVITVINPQLAPNVIISLLGAILSLPALLSLIGFFSAQKQGAPLPGYMLITTCGALIMGLWLLLQPSFFSAIITIALGISLSVAGLIQFIMLYRAGRSQRILLYVYIFPVIIILIGILTLFNPFDTINSIMIIFGISAIIYGLSDIIRFYRYNE